jgi:hypothetical protein
LLFRIHLFQDERLLSRQAAFLYEKRDWERFLPVVRTLLAPYFHEVTKMARQDAKTCTVVVYYELCNIYSQFAATNALLKKWGVPRILWQLCIDELANQDTNEKSLTAFVNRVGSRMQKTNKRVSDKYGILTADDLQQMAFHVCFLLLCSLLSICSGSKCVT